MTSPAKHTTTSENDTSRNIMNELHVLHTVHESQRELVDRVHDKQRWATQRRQALNDHLNELRRRESEDMAELERQKATLDQEEKDLLTVKQKVDALLGKIDRNRRELQEWTVQRITSHDTTRAMLDQESIDLNALERHIEDLCTEIAMHARDAETRYRRRLEEAEQARRRWEEDVRDVSNLEEKLRTYQTNGVPVEESYNRYISTPIPALPPASSTSSQNDTLDEEVSRIQREIAMMEQRLLATDVAAAVSTTASRPSSRVHVLSPSRQNVSLSYMPIVKPSPHHSMLHTANTTTTTTTRSFGGMRSPPRRSSVAGA